MAIILDGFGPYNNLNRIALASLSAGFNFIGSEREFENLHGKVNEVFLKAHYDVFDEKRGDIAGGVSATAVKFVEINRLKTAIFGHVGFTRVYSLHDGILKLWTVDNGWYVDYNNLSLSRDLMEILDGIRTPDEAKLYLQYPPIERLWGASNIPLTYLGVTRPQRLESVLSGFIPVFPGDKLIMTTVGVHRHLNRSEMTELVSQESPVNVLLEQAQLRAQDKDHFRRTPMADFSAIVVENIS